MKPIFHRQHSKAQKMRWIFIQNELDNLQTVYRVMASVKVCHKQPKQSKGWMKYRKLTKHCCVYSAWRRYKEHCSPYFHSIRSINASEDWFVLLEFYYLLDGFFKILAKIRKRISCCEDNIVQMLYKNGQSKLRYIMKVLERT